jgi:hypothetical protein
VEIWFFGILDLRFFSRMWCSTCQQDVPGLGSPSGGGELRCGKCGGGLASTGHVPGPPIELAEGAQPLPVGRGRDQAALEKLLHGTPLAGDDWALEAELRGVQRLLGSMKSRPIGAAEAVAIHAPHFGPESWHASSLQAPSSASVSSPPAERQQPRSHAAAWTILSLSLATFVCGAVLLGWSLVAQRQDLWPVGMPLALIGQAGLILGLVLQLDGLWHSSRKTATALSDLDGELKNVRQATTLLSASHASGAQSFYLHLAEGAAPQLLLADLKGQMDLLAQQMARNGK